MGRFYIDTDELSTLAQQLRSDAGELGEINLDLVRGWSHALPPPAQLISFGAESGWIQAQIGTLAAGVVGDSAMLDIEVAQMLAEEGVTDVVGALGALVGGVETKWSDFATWEEKVVSTTSRDALSWLQSSLKTVANETDHLGLVAVRAVPEWSSRIMRDEDLTPFEAAIVHVAEVGKVLGAVGSLGLLAFDAGKFFAYDDTKQIIDSERYGPGSVQARSDERVLSQGVGTVLDDAVDALPFVLLIGATAASTPALFAVGAVLTAATIGLALFDVSRGTDYSQWLTPSHDIKSAYHWVLPQVEDRTGR